MGDNPAGHFFVLRVLVLISFYDYVTENAGHRQYFW